MAVLGSPSLIVPTVSVDVKQHLKKKKKKKGEEPELRSCVKDEEDVLVEVLLYLHRKRRFIRGGSPGRPPRLLHSS